MGTLLQTHSLKAEQCSPLRPLPTVSEFHYKRKKGGGLQSEIVLPGVILLKNPRVGPSASQFLFVLELHCLTQYHWPHVVIYIDLN